MSTFRLVTAATVANPHVHDLFLDDSGQVELIGTDITDLDDYGMSVGQSVKCRFLLVKGEWYQDQRRGSPWRERVWVKGATASSLRRMAQQIVTTTPGVRSIESMAVSLDAATREATVSDLQIVTETGQIVTVASLDEPMIIEAP